MKKLILSLAIAITLVVIAASSLLSQSTTGSFQVILPDTTSTGISGGIVEVRVNDGISGTPTDLNCNGNEDFMDVVAHFLDLIGVTELPNCRTVLPVASMISILGIDVEDFGTSQVITQDPDFIEFAFADLNQIIPPDDIDILIATVNFDVLSIGEAIFEVTFTSLDDDLGNALPMQFTSGVIR